MIFHWCCGENGLNVLFIYLSTTASLIVLQSHFCTYLPNIIRYSISAMFEFFVPLPIMSFHRQFVYLYRCFCSFSGPALSGIVVLCLALTISDTKSRTLSKIQDCFETLAPSDGSITLLNAFISNVQIFKLFSKELYFCEKFVK